MKTHLVIPDLQLKPGVPMEHLTWIGKWIVKHKPDVIINIGDMADMESLCSYDQGKKSFEGRRYKEDIRSVEKGMDLLLGPMRAFNKRAAKGHRQRYKPRMVLTLGNHEERIARVSEWSPQYTDLIGYKDLPYDDWEVIPYLVPIEIDGVRYAHYFINPESALKGVLGGQMTLRLKTLGHSFTQGHQQTFLYGTKYLTNGKVLQGLVAGCCYLHDESYMGPQGNYQFRGIVKKTFLGDGTYDPEFISLEQLRQQFGESK